MSSFGRSLRRGTARNSGLMVSAAKEAKEANRGRRAWCPTCQTTCDSWRELVWSEPDKNNHKTLLCARCKNPVTFKNLFELPPGTTKHGLTLRPPPGGWVTEAKDK